MLNEHEKEEDSFLQIVNVEYGMNDKYINITDKVKELFLKNNQLFISKKINLNNTFNDPCFGIQKEIRIIALLNNKPINLSAIGSRAVPADHGCIRRKLNNILIIIVQK